MNANKYLLLGALVAFAAGCDPYTDEPGGAATVLRVSTMAGFSSDNGGTSTEGTATAVAGAPATCDDATGDVAANEPVFWVTFNKTLDGASIEAQPYDCTPAAGWLTVTPAAPAGSAWFSCYVPSSPVPGEGASIAIFQAPVPTAPAVVDGWDLTGGLAASGTAVQTYTVTGTVKDKKGQATALSFTVSYDPNPGTAGDPAASNVTQTSVDLAWTAPGCNATAEYVLERAPNDDGGTPADPADDAPGTYAPIGGGNIAALTFQDTGLTAGTTYWYRVTAVTVAGAASYPGPSSGDVSVTTLP